MTNPIYHLQLFAEEGGAAPEVPGEDLGRKAALYDAFAPTLEALGKKYGTGQDPAALEAALRQEEQANLARRQAQAGKLCDAWMDQAEKTRERYPGFDLAAEMKDPRFLGMLRSQVDVRTAYEALHPREAMDYREQQLIGKLSQNRPRENGTASQGAAVTRQDVARMSKSDRQDIIRRVQRGERISF